MPVYIPNILMFYRVEFCVDLFHEQNLFFKFFKTNYTCLEEAKDAVDHFMNNLEKFRKLEIFS